MSKYNLIDIYEEYQIGSGWTRDFDYDGMLMAGLKAGVDTDLETLKKISDDFEDVNYHRENSHLQSAIEALEDGATKEAAMFFGDFHAEINKTIKDQGMDIEPTVGQFMASKMEEGEDKDKDKEPRDGVKSAAAKLGIKPSHVKEVTSREGARMEGLVNQRMKAKFLEAFADLYFDLTDEDPFQAEDVVDYLGIEMLKHLDNIQAQGEKLAGVNTDADFEREQRMQMGMREEDSVDEAIFGPAEFLKSKGIGKEAISAFMKMHSKDIIGASEDEIVDEFINFATVNTEFLNDKVEDLKYGGKLKEHFSRFLKDYQ